MRNLVRGAVACAILLIGMSGPAHADIIFFFSPGAVQPDQNLQYTDDGLILTGTTVQGSADGTIFDITGLEPLEVVSSGARVETLDNGFTWLFFEPNEAGVLFGEFEANLLVYSPPGPPVSGTVTVHVTNNFGDVETASYDVGAGQNFFALRAVDPQLIRSILITSTVDLADIRQIRVGGIETPDGGGNGEVPEAGSLLLFGMGLLAVGRHFRRTGTRNA